MQTDAIQQSSSDQLIDLDRFDPDATAVPLDYSSLSLQELEKLIDHVYSNPISAECEAAIVAKWNLLVDREGVDIVVAQLSKFQPSGGLGISLEGTVDVEEGREVRPHHYIRSILPEGPVGTNGILHSGDELLEVNGRKLLGLSHVEVVAILKELPQSVRMVCARRQLTSQLPSSQPANDDQERAAAFSPRVLPTFFNSIYTLTLLNSYSFSLVVERSRWKSAEFSSAFGSFGQSQIRRFLSFDIDLAGSRFTACQEPSLSQLGTFERTRHLELRAPSH